MREVMPQSLIPTQPNLGELIGDIFASFNLDLTSDLGRIKVSPRTIKIDADTDSGLSALVRVAQFIRTQARGSDEWWAIADQKLFYSNANADPRTALIADATANSPTTQLSYLYSDADEFSGDLIVSLLTNLARLSAGTWTASWWITTLGQRAMVTGIPHPVRTIFNNLFLVGDQVAVNNEAGKGEKAGQASIHAIDINSNVSLNRLVFKKQFKVVFILTNNSEVWIGLSHKFSGKAEMIYWDGNSINFNLNFKIDDPTLMGGTMDSDGVPCVVDGKGRLLRFNGRGFKEIARLPIANNKYYKWGGPEWGMHKNGICLIDGRINMLVTGGIHTDTKGGVEGFYSGIWEFDERIGLYHKHGVTNTNDNVINMGSPVVRRVGALVETERQYGTFMGAVELSTDNDTTLVNVVFISDIFGTSGSTITDNVLKTGFFITRKYKIRELEDHWEQMALRFQKLLNSTDKIFIKYRTDFKNYTNPNYKFATWATTTTITVASSQTMSDVSVGDEVLILSGKGAGICTKITALSLNAGNYTVTVDYTFTGASNGNTLLLQIKNWTTMPFSSSQDYISNQSIRFMDLPIGDKSDEIQFKVVAFGKGDSPSMSPLLISSQESVVLE